MSEKQNIQQVVPFFGVTDMRSSLKFYIDGLGFKKTNEWIVDGGIRWCWIQREGAALMLQEFFPRRTRVDPVSTKQSESSNCFICSDAIILFHEFTDRGLTPSLPFVGNGMWVISLTDPDGYRLEFESLTSVEEGTVYKEDLHRNL